MTPPAEPNDEARVDTWFARQHRGMGADLASALDLDTGLHEILLAGQHRDMGSTLADALDLDVGLAAILPHHKRRLPEPTQLNSFTDLLDWLSAVPMARLTHRSRLYLLAIDAKILHLVSGRHTRSLGYAADFALAHEGSSTRARALARALALARRFALALAGGGYERTHIRARELTVELIHALNLARDLNLNRARDCDLDRDLDRVLNRELDHARDLAPNQTDDLVQTLCGMLMTVEVEDLLCAISGQLSADVSWLDPTTIDPQETVRLNDLAVDFTGVDLREATLSGLDLVGVRWSRTTRWPQVDVDWIVAASAPVCEGVYEIQGSSASDDVTVAPKPVLV